MRWVRAVVCMLFLGVALWGLQARVHWVSSFEYFPSTDAYFYLVEFKQRLLRTDIPHYVTWSPFFSITSIAGSLLGLSPSQLYIAVLFFGLASLSLAAGLVAYHWGAWVLAASTFTFVWLSDTLFYRQFAFLAQGFGMGLWVLGIVLYEVCKTRRGYRYLGMILMLLGSAQHVFVAGLTILFLVFRFTDRSLVGYAFRVVFIAGGVLCCTWLFARPIVNFGTLGFQLGLFEACTFRSCSVREWADAGLVLLLVAVSFLFYRHQSLSLRALVLIIVCLNLPIWAHEGHMVYRLALSSFWVFIAALLLAGKYEQGIHPGWLLTGIVSVLLYIGGTFLTPAILYRPVSGPTHDLDRFADTLKAWLPADAALVAKHGLQFQAAYFLERHAAKSLSDLSAAAKVYELMPVNRRLDTECEDIEAAVLAENTCVRLPSNWVIKLLERSE